MSLPEKRAEFGTSVVFQDHIGPDQVGAGFAATGGGTMTVHTLSRVQRTAAVGGGCVRHLPVISAQSVAAGTHRARSADGLLAALRHERCNGQEGHREESSHPDCPF